MKISFWAGLTLNIILLNEVNITLLNRLTYTQNLLYNVNDNKNHNKMPGILSVFWQFFRVLTVADFTKKKFCNPVNTLILYLNSEKSDVSE